MRERGSSRLVFPLLCLLLVGVLGGSCALMSHYSADSPKGIFVASVDRLASAVEPDKAAPPRTLVAHYKVVDVAGVSAKFVGNEITMAVQGPDHLRLAASVKGRDFQFGRNGEQLWVYAAATKLCVLGEPGLARFKSAPESVDTNQLGPLKLPLARKRIPLLAHYLNVSRQPDAVIGTDVCQVLTVEAQPRLVRAHRLPAGQLQLWIRQSDLLPERIRFANDHGVHVTLEAVELGFQPPLPGDRWAYVPAADDHVQPVARAHLTEFISARRSLLTAKIPTLGPATGERRVVATEGKGRLEMVDGTKVLLVKGSPEEMGEQHGALLKKSIRSDVRRVLYGMGVAASLANGKWFFDEMDAAEQRLLPHMDERYVQEMDAIADTAGVSRAEVRMANMFPELFHCSGFAIFGEATAGGHLYHGRILDYFRGQGLEQNAVVIVSQPDYGHAWVNVSYAGFVGSVTAMNEKHVAIGEMGGHGEGQWDGKPMAQLVREIMEKVDTIDDALEIMRRGPRTCEYYYVISDGNSRRAVAVHATPTEFETAWAGEKHPLLPEAIKDAVFVSGGDRMKELIRRIKAGYGKFDEASARDLMTRPVCMNSNIHSVLFEPETLDFWVANADSQNVASATRYRHYNLGELLQRGSQLAARGTRLQR